VQLAATSLFYLFFLTEVAGLPASMAGLVLLVGRAFDAFSDPAMGRVSDATRWRAGRRRPYFLIGALPFGATFALLWTQLPLDRDAARFAAYAALYVVNTLCSTVLAVPYMALLPEMATSYEERTSANGWRAAGVVMAVLLTAVSMRPLVAAFGGGPGGWARTGAVLGLVVALPWLVVHRVSFERPGFQGRAASDLRSGLRHLAGHAAFRCLAAFFLAARIATDVVGAMLLFWFTYWLDRPGLFSPALGLMLGTVALSIPVWLRFSARFDKRTLFGVGVVWWIAIQAGLATLDASSPTALVLAIVALAGIGYGVCDLMPWSMLGDVIDEDELRSGQRREGLYAGVFTFLRKLGGATGVAVAGLLLDAAGFEAGRAQGEAARQMIRLLVAGVPALSLALALALALAYPITRERHAEIQTRLAARLRAS
jgi:sugar (glycoside-pentoside-hexuronide) transporter